MEDNFAEEASLESNEMPDFKAFQSPVQTPVKEINSFFDLFIPSKGYFVAPILININILIFILMLIYGANFFHSGGIMLLKWGANFRPYTLGGEWWRLLTCCFIHIGIYHLITNMCVLIYLGLLLEPLIGRTRFITAYLLTCIVSSLNSLVWHELTTSAGASGAIFGMCGVFISLLLTNYVEKKDEILIWLSLMIGLNLIFGFLPRTDSSAHIAGLISGLIIGFAFIPGLRNPENIVLKYSTVGILTTAILIIAIAEFNILPSKREIYNDKVKLVISQWDRNNDLTKNNKDTHPSNIYKYTLAGGVSNEDEGNDLVRRGIFNREEKFRSATSAGSSSRSGDIATYEEKMKTFVSSESQALEFYNLSGSTPKDKLLYALQDRGIYYWNLNINIIDEIDKLNLPSSIHEKNSKMRQYCKLRISSFELMYKAIEKDSKRDKALIEYYDEEIKKLIVVIKKMN